MSAPSTPIDEPAVQERSRPPGTPGTGPAGPVVLYIVNAAWFFLSHRLPLARAARDAGYTVHLLTAVDSEGEERACTREGIVVHRAPLARAGMNPFADLRFFLCVRRVIRAVAPTLVHNVTVKPVLYGTLAARLAGVQGIVNAISGLGYAFSDKSRWVLAAVLRQAYRFALHGARVHVIFQNDDDAREFAAAGLVRASQITKIRGSGVDLRHFWPADEDSTEPPLVLLPARMLRDKGITEFVRAAQLLCRDGCSARFVLAGRLDHNNPAAFTRSELEQLLRDAPVEWLGHVEDMPALLRRAHIVCLPSYREGLPKSLIEACAVGRPIVTTDVPGCRAVVADGLNGLLVPPRDAEALAAALRRLIPDKELRAFLGRAARQRAEREFSVDSVVAQTLALYALAVQPG